MPQNQVQPIDCIRPSANTV